MPYASKEAERKFRSTPAQRARKSAYTKLWRERNREKIIAKNKLLWINRDMAKESGRRRFWRYGISLEQFNAIIEAQNKKCGLCQENLKFGTKAVHVDHCHATGVVRGILCARCNLGIGRFGDTVEGLEKAIAYLKRGLS